MENYNVDVRGYEQHKNNTITELAVNLNSYQVLSISRCSALAYDTINNLYQAYIDEIAQLTKEEKTTS
jgi:hypothetical protein